MSRLAIYNSNIVDVIFAAFPLKDGRADPFFRIAPQAPRFQIEGPGADGLVTRCATNNHVYTITLSFKGSSSEIAKLSALYVADGSAEGGAGVAPLMCKDRNGSTLIATDRAWIATFDEVGFGINRQDVSFELHAIIPPAGLLLGGA